MGLKYFRILQLWKCYVKIEGTLSRQSSNGTGTLVDDGKARGKDLTRLPVLNLPLCHWSRQLFDLRAPSSTDVPVLLLNQPFIK